MAITIPWGSRSRGEMQECPGEPEARFKKGTDRLDAECFRGVMSGVDHTEIVLDRIDRGVMWPFAHDQRIDAAIARFPQ